MRKMFGFLVGLFVGGLVGAAIALLFAPESGDSFRGKVEQRTSGFFGEIRSAVEERRKALEDQLASMRSPYNN